MTIFTLRGIDIFYILLLFISVRYYAANVISVAFYLLLIPVSFIDFQVFFSVLSLTVVFEPIFPFFYPTYFLDIIVFFCLFTIIKRLVQFQFSGYFLHGVYIKVITFHKICSCEVIFFFHWNRSIISITLLKMIHHLTWSIPRRPLCLILWYGPSQMMNHL